MFNLISIGVFAGFMLAAGTAFALPAQANAPAQHAISLPPNQGGQHGPSFGNFLDGSEFGQAHPDNVPPETPWTDTPGYHGPPDFGNGHGAGGWENRWSRLPDTPHGCSPDKPGCVFLAPGDITPAVPEPEAYALMLAGLAMLRLATRRRPARR